VGKGEEMNSVESSYQKGVLIDEDSCGFADHVNEDDEKLNTPIAVEEDQRCVLIIGGIQIFLPNSPTETNTRVAHEEVVQQESKKEAMGQMILKITVSVMQVQQKKDNQQGLSKRRRRRRH
jgi:hypothetical protein